MQEEKALLFHHIPGSQFAPSYPCDRVKNLRITRWKETLEIICPNSPFLRWSGELGNGKWNVLMLITQWDQCQGQDWSPGLQTLSPKFLPLCHGVAATRWSWWTALRLPLLWPCELPVFGQPNWVQEAQLFCCQPRAPKSGLVNQSSAASPKSKANIDL